VRETIKVITLIALMLALFPVVFTLMIKWTDFVGKWIGG
jgi:hypothetical protein